MSRRGVVLTSFLMVILLGMLMSDALGAWQIETVDNVSWYTSLAIDSSDNVHISYYDMGNEALKYATNASGAWQIETVDSNVGLLDSVRQSIAVDSMGKVHISYPFNASGRLYLKYATNAFGGWWTTIVDSGDENYYFGGEKSSIALDSSGSAHIIYDLYSAVDGVLHRSLKYATNVSGLWQTETIMDSDSGLGGLKDVSIAIDSYDNPHISYYYHLSNNLYLKYATKRYGAWLSTTVVGYPRESASAALPTTSIALDSSDNAHIIYYDMSGSYSVIKYATNVSGVWQAETVTPYGGTRFSSLALDSSGKAHISYYSQFALKYATNVSGAWQTETVDDSDGVVGLYNSIALDSRDNVHISYYSNRDLKHAQLVIMPPAADAGGAYVCIEGETVQLDGSGSTDSDGTIQSYEWDLDNDGQYDDTTGATPIYSCADNGIYNIFLRVTDNDGLWDTDLTTVTVSHADPVVEVRADLIVNECQTVNLVASFTDAGALDTHTAQIDWGDGTIEAGSVYESAGAGTVLGSHDYDIEGTYTVTVTVTDDDGGSGSDTLTVIVDKAVALVEAGADQTVNEGDTVLITSTFIDPCADIEHIYTAQISWGDGTVEAGLVDKGTGTVSGSHIYADDGTYTVMVTVSVSDADAGTDSLTIIVNNTPPIVHTGLDQTVEEGDTISFNASFTDTGSLDTHTAQIDWGDGTAGVGIVYQSLGTVHDSHVYEDDGTYTVTVTVTDDDGGSGSNIFTVTVNNVAPSVDAGADQTVNMSDVVGIASTFTDAGALDTHTAQIDWGDGTIEAGLVNQSEGTVSGNHIYTDGGTFTVIVTVTDDDEASGSETLSVAVCVYGDVDGNGIVDIQDVIKALMVAVGIEEEMSSCAFDLVDILDAIEILRIAAGLD